MKKIIALFAFAATMSLGFAQSLPNEADNFIHTFFPNMNIIEVAQSNNADMAYRAELDDNLVIIFNSEGQWQIVESFSTDISALLSQKCKDAILSNNNNPITAVKIERNRPNYETRVTFNDGFVMIFDANGNFVRNDY